MSSRNQYLTPEDRRAALTLSRSLREAEAMYRSGERRARVIRDRVQQLLADEPRVSVQYAALVDARELTPVRVIDRPALLALAAFVGKTRLIDNTVLGEKK
jgi:pantoate--beta-alanine ligase